MEKNKVISKLCCLETTFYIVFLTILILHYKKGQGSDHSAAYGASADFSFFSWLCRITGIEGLSEKFAPKCRF